MMANENMKISQDGRNLIKKWEGLRLTAYQDSVGVWTIGYGHTKGVYAGMTITENQANAFLDEDIKSHAAGIFNYVTVQLTQGQFDALVSFHFNLGPAILAGSQLLVYLNSRQWQAAANEMKKYVYAGGQILQGLVNRRNDEVALFLKEGGVIEPSKDMLGDTPCFFEVEGDPTLYYFDGKGITGIAHPDEKGILNTIYKANYGKDMPTVRRAVGWFSRLRSVSTRPLVK